MRLTKPNDSADVLQQKLQEKFAAQRRKDLLAMQASGNLKPKAHSVPKSTEWSPKKSSKGPESPEQAQHPKNAAHGKKATKRSKRKGANSVEVQSNEVTESTNSTETQIAAEPPTSIEIPAEKVQESQGAQDKEFIETERVGNVLGEQTTTAQKLDDIVDVLESPKNQKKAAKAVKLARKSNPLSKGIKRKAAIVPKPDVSSGKAAALIRKISSQLLARLKAYPNDTSGSLQELKVSFHISCDAIED